MKNIVLIVAGALIFASAGMGAAKHFWRGETKSISEVKKRWGDSPFDADKFKNGDELARAQMAYSLLKDQKLFFGKDRGEIRKLLGDYDGFYFSDMFPTYIIETGKNQSQSTWQLVFLLDRKEKVAQIIVHKNCCD